MTASLPCNQNLLSRSARTRVLGALLLVAAGCDSADDLVVESEDVGAAEEARIAAQISITQPPVGFADASASLATPATKALFPEGLCDDVYEFRFFGAGGPGTPYQVQPGGEYQPTVQFDAPWGNETVQAVMFKPLIDNPKVTHHFILMAGTFNWLDAWAPGNEDPALPDDVGVELPKGPRAIGLNMHYYNLSGPAAEPDRSGLAVCTVRGKRLRPKVAALHTGFTSIRPVMVPPLAKSHDVVSTCTAQVKEPVTFYQNWPHAHRLGRHMKFTVTKPDGRVLTLHDEPFNFVEQDAFPLVPNYIVENGDKFTFTCTYDNDTNKNVAWGENTDDEMCFNFVSYYPKGALTCGIFGSLGGVLGGGGIPAAPMR